MTMGNQSGIPEAKIIGALRKWGGIKALAAKELKTTRQNINGRVNRSPKIQEALSEIEEENLDIGEGHLIKALRNGDKDTVRYYLDRKGKKRGYGNRVDVGVDDATAEAIVAGLGGSVEAFRAALRQLGVASSEIP